MKSSYHLAQRTGTFISIVSIFFQAKNIKRSVLHNTRAMFYIRSCFYDRRLIVPSQD